MSDTNEITNGCLTHYDNRHIQTRIDFMGLCPFDKAGFKEKPKEKPNRECMAKIMRLMETLTDHAKIQWKLACAKAKEKGLHIPQEPKEYPLELSNGAIVSLIYNTFEESIVRNSLDYLVEIGYLKRKQTKKNAIPIYWLQLGYIQTLLQQQAEAVLSGCEFLPPHMQGVISNPSPVISNHTSVNSNPATPFSHPSGSDFTPNNISKIDDKYEKQKEERVASPHVDATAPAFSENENVSQHDHSRKEDDWACNNWRGAHKGKTCTDYQAYIDSGQREETPTEPRTPAIQMGATHERLDTTDTAVSGISHQRDDHLHAASHQETPQVAIGATDGHPTPNHPPAVHRAADSVRADGAGEPEAPVKQTTPARGIPPTERNDGAATEVGSEPAPSGKQLPLSLKEDEPTVRPETPAQRKRRIEAREKEIWALVEEKLQTKFTRTQRQTRANQEGMENLIEDETNDQTIKTALDRLEDFWRAQFNLKQFHALIPGLLAAKAPTPTTNGKPANSDAPVKRWSMAEHKRMLKELEASQTNLQA